MRLLFRSKKLGLVKVLRAGGEWNGISEGEWGEWNEKSEAGQEMNLEFPL